MKKKILIVGAGGIGSFLIPLLDRVKIYDITVFDPDVVEEKNLLYQNYEKSDINSNKAEIMMTRYSSVLLGSPYPILTHSQIKGYDLVVCCADNLAVRRMIYMSKQNILNGVKWLDLRAQGRNGVLISHLVDINLLDTFLEGPDGSFSCQAGDWDGTGKGVNLSHTIIAGMGAQWIQKYFNGEKVIEQKMVNI
tara:strand:- start:651 stop:1229 length:579 start_codon:yes stop_codon:yes gene_type:complete